MRMNYPYDDASIAARCAAQELLAVGAREQVFHEAGRTPSLRAPTAAVGHLLVRFGQWLQTLAQQPIYQEETV